MLLDESDNVVGTYRIGDASTSNQIDIDISEFTPISAPYLMGVDIGSVGTAGSSSMIDGNFVVRGGGAGESSKSGYHFF